MSGGQYSGHLRGHRGRLDIIVLTKLTVVKLAITELTVIIVKLAVIKPTILLLIIVILLIKWVLISVVKLTAIILLVVKLAIILLIVLLIVELAGNTVARQLGGKYPLQLSLLNGKLWVNHLTHFGRGGCDGSLDRRAGLGNCAGPRLTAVVKAQRLGVEHRFSGQVFSWFYDRSVLGGLLPQLLKAKVHCRQIGIPKGGAQYKGIIEVDALQLR